MTTAKKIKNNSSLTPKKVFDVSMPGSVVPSKSARPIISDHHILQADPMVSEVNKIDEFGMYSKVEPKGKNIAPIESTISVTEDDKAEVSEEQMSPETVKLDLRKTSSRSELDSNVLKPILSGGEAPEGTSTTEKSVLADRNSSGEAGILRKSSKDESESNSEEKSLGSTKLQGKNTDEPTAQTKNPEANSRPETDIAKNFQDSDLEEINEAAGLAEAKSAKSAEDAEEKKRAEEVAELIESREFFVKLAPHKSNKIAKILAAIVIAVVAISVLAYFLIYQKL